LYVVIEALAGLDQRVDNLILSANRRHIGSVEVDIGAVADMVPLQALLLLVACGERLIFMPAILSLALEPKSQAGRSGNE
jgi:hypothetical protein